MIDVHKSCKVKKSSRNLKLITNNCKVYPLSQCVTVYQPAAASRWVILLGTQQAEGVGAAGRRRTVGVWAVRQKYINRHLINLKSKSNNRCVFQNHHTDGVFHRDTETKVEHIQNWKHVRNVTIWLWVWLIVQQEPTRIFEKKTKNSISLILKRESQALLCSPVHYGNYDRCHDRKAVK